MEKWTPIFNLIIALASAMISTFLIPFLRKKISRANWETTLKMIDIAVAAAEQMFPDPGDRRSYALEYLQSRGITLDETTITAMEAAVLKLHRELYGEWEKKEGDLECEPVSEE